ncbi:hypothetical protein O7627_24410 [Solwaraspora sp. WMMD1047]|uniref:DUF7213 family protein n=1 Tax=Solwaraspora sp. WMMD1047 TaxID=3016102 RepID=UPI0024180862|nr:hypothetical protein [Solwaraspora sp. WMMD1047]MDG4832427.1 hypothetical protein [Solwaraspora sp. WMMD1047]
MTDSRTPEQRAADDALTAAIQQTLDAYAGSGPWLLTEYVVVTAQQGYDEDGDGITAVGQLYRDGDVPLHRALGLLDHAVTRMRARIASDGD